MSKLRTPMSFYTRGVSCIKDSRFLFENRGATSNFGILLIHGVELLLSSFLLIKDRTLTAHEIYDKYHHNYRDMLDACKEFDEEKRITSDEVCSYIGFLAERFSPSTADIRFPRYAVLREFPLDLFDILEVNFVDPMFFITKEWLKNDDQTHIKAESSGR
jgi:hypothetical protein